MLRAASGLLPLSFNLESNTGIMHPKFYSFPPGLSTVDTPGCTKLNTMLNEVAYYVFASLWGVLMRHMNGYEMIWDLSGKNEMLHIVILYIDIFWPINSWAFKMSPTCFQHFKQFFRINLTRFFLCCLELYGDSCEKTSHRKIPPSLALGLLQA